MRRGRGSRARFGIVASRRRSRRSRKSLLLVFALIFAPVAARAACVEFASPPEITTAADQARAVVTGDINGDGDLDVISASPADDKIAWYENNGAGTGWTIHTVTLGADGAWSVAVSDVDGDGDNDLLSASFYESEVDWYENLTGDGTSWTTHAVSTVAYAAVSVVAGDIDGDGDRDALAGLGSFGRIYWFANDGSGGGWTVTVVTTTAGVAEAVFAADVDRDGDLDAISASRTNPGKIAWYDNVDVSTSGTGNGATWSEVSISTGAIFGNAVFAADLDGDGDTDVVSAASFDHEVAWYENLVPGDGTSWTTHLVSTTLLAAYGAVAADVDGDGDPDLLSASRTDDAVAWFENNGTGSAWTRHTLTTAADFALGVAAGDVDGDGDLDALSASGNDDTIAWYRNDRLHGTALFATTATISTVLDETLSAVAGDLDGDGDLDVLADAFTSDLVGWFANDGTGGGWTPHTISTGGDGPTPLAAADVDGDGDLDALVPFFLDGEVDWFENDGSGGGWTQHLVAFPGSSLYSVAAADVDGDGHTDVLTASYDNDLIAWHENLDPDGAGTAWTIHTISDLADGAHSVFAADVDRDGDLDALSASRGDDKIAWYENAGAGTSWTLHTITTDAYLAYSVFAGDIDGDGDLDALSASAGDYTIAWYENLAGNGSSWTARAIWTMAYGAYAVRAGDVDGDGDLDVFSASRDDGQVAWFENRGLGAAWSPHSIAIAALQATSAFAADLDGDGDLDMLSSSQGNDTIAWYPNLGTHVHDDGFDSDGATTACWSSSVPPVP